MTDIRMNTQNEEISKDIISLKSTEAQYHLFIELHILINIGSDIHSKTAPLYIAKFDPEEITPHTSLPLPHSFTPPFISKQWQIHVSVSYIKYSNS